MNPKKKFKEINEEYPKIGLKFKKLRKSFMRAKIYVQRSMGYVSIVNSGMIMFLFLSKLNDYGFNIELKKYAVIIFVITLLILITFGFLEDYLGFYKAEKEFGSSRDPYISSIKKINKNIEEIKEKIL
jgi:UDP-N-acetylmuramyl pentapeptide phosphotransferase/UDP-N-acetylglucosamine-1-phosphate transferase